MFVSPPCRKGISSSSVTRPLARSVVRSSLMAMCPPLEVVSSLSFQHFSAIAIRLLSVMFSHPLSSSRSHKISQAPPFLGSSGDAYVRSIFVSSPRSQGISSSSVTFILDGWMLANRL